MPGVTAGKQGEAARPAWTLQPGECLTDHAWSPDARYVAVGDAVGRLTLLVAEDGRVERVFDAHEGDVLQTAWSPDGELIATSGLDGAVRAWRAVNGERLGVWASEGEWVNRIAWSPDGRHLALTAGKVLRVMNRRGETVLEYAGHASTVTALDWHQGGGRLLTACYRGVRLFTLGDRHREPRVLGCMSALVNAAWSPSGRYVCAGSQDREVHFWDLKPTRPAHMVMRGYASKVAALSWSPDSRRVATAGGEAVVVWRTEGRGPAGSRPDEHRTAERRLTAVAWSPDGKRLAASGTEGGVYIWPGAGARGEPERYQMEAPVTTMGWSAHAGLLIGDRAGYLTAMWCRDA